MHGADTTVEEVSQGERHYSLNAKDNFQFDRAVRFREGFKKKHERVDLYQKKAYLYDR